MTSKIEQIKNKVIEKELERLHNQYIKLNFPDDEAKKILKKAWKYTIEDTIKETAKTIKKDFENGAFMKTIILEGWENYWKRWLDENSGKGKRFKTI